MKNILLVILLVVSPNTFALSIGCGGPEKEERIRNTENVFIGEVIEHISTRQIRVKIDYLTPQWRPHLEQIARLKIIQNIRGEERTYQTVDFSYETNIGDKYIVFDNTAFAVGCPGVLSTKLADAAWALEILGIDSTPARIEELKAEGGPSPDAIGIDFSSEDQVVFNPISFERVVFRNNISGEERTFSSDLSEVKPFFDWLQDDTKRWEPYMGSDESEGLFYYSSNGYIDYIGQYSTMISGYAMSVRSEALIIDTIGPFYYRPQDGVYRYYASPLDDQLRNIIDTLFSQ